MSQKQKHAQFLFLLSSRGFFNGMFHCPINTNRNAAFDLIFSIMESIRHGSFDCVLKFFERLRTNNFEQKNHQERFDFYKTRLSSHCSNCLLDFLLFSIE